MKKSTKIIRIILQVVVSLAFLAAGVTKLIGNAQEVMMFSTLHLDSTLIIIGILEVLIAIGIWCKKTRTAAILLASAILGAAFAETITIGMASAVIGPGIVLLAVWGIFAIDHCD